MRSAGCGRTPPAVSVGSAVPCLGTAARPTPTACAQTVRTDVPVAGYIWGDAAALGAWGLHQAGTGSILKPAPQATATCALSTPIGDATSICQHSSVAAALAVCVLLALQAARRALASARETPCPGAVQASIPSARVELARVGSAAPLASAAPPQGFAVTVSLFDTSSGPFAALMRGHTSTRQLV